MDLGVCTITGQNRPVEELIAIAAKVGVSGLEVWGRDHVGEGSRQRCETIATAAAARGLDLPVYGSYLRAGSEAFADQLEREVRIAANLGASLIRVWAGEQEYADVTSDHWDAVIADLNRLAEQAGDRDIGVTVERHAGTVTDATEGAAAVIDETSDRVGLNWQPEFRQDAETVRDDIDALADVTNNVHLQAVAAPGETERCPLAFAYFDVSDVVASLAASGFDGYLEIEFVSDRAPYTPTLAADVAFLERVQAEL